MQRVTCECGNVLGQLIDGVFIIRHRRRVVIARDVDAIVCERCERRTNLAKPKAQVAG